jgi:hypothetical protein
MKGASKVSAVKSRNRAENRIIAAKRAQGEHKPKKPRTRSSQQPSDSELGETDNDESSPPSSSIRTKRERYSGRTRARSRTCANGTWDSETSGHKLLKVSCLTGSRETGSDVHDRSVTHRTASILGRENGRASNTRRSESF